MLHTVNIREKSQRESRRIATSEWFFGRFASVLLACAVVCGQTALPSNRVQTFHVHGTVRDAYKGAPLPGVKVTFRSEGIGRTVNTNQRGMYEVDLPVGVYSMTARPQDLKLPEYERPLFRVASSTSITLDISFDDEVQDNCDIGVRAGNQYPKAEDFVNACGGSVSFPVPSEDGVRFQLFIRFGRRESTRNGYVYSAAWNLTGDSSHIGGSNAPDLGTQVFVAYNLFTLRADHVTYDAKTRRLEATGRVVVAQIDGRTQHAESMAFTIEDGRALRLP